MAWAICRRCGRETSWRATKGSSMPLRCRHMTTEGPIRYCEGALESKTRGRRGSNFGKHAVTCRVCHKQRFKGVHPVPFAFGVLQMVRAEREASSPWECLPKWVAYNRLGFACGHHRIRPMELVEIPGRGPEWLALGDLVEGPPRYYDAEVSQWIRGGAVAAKRMP